MLPYFALESFTCFMSRASVAQVICTVLRLSLPRPVILLNCAAIRSALSRFAALDQPVWQGVTCIQLVSRPGQIA
jgi:hypothetical protein